MLIFVEEEPVRKVTELSDNETETGPTPPKKSRKSDEADSKVVLFCLSVLQLQSVSYFYYGVQMCFKS